MDGESLFSDLASPSRPHINRVWRWLLPIALSFPSQISASLSFLSLCGGTWWARQRWLPGAMASDPDPLGLRSLPAPVVTPCPWVSGRPGGGGVRGGGSGRSHRCLSAHAPRPPLHPRCCSLPAFCRPINLSMAGAIVSLCGLGIDKHGPPVTPHPNTHTLPGRLPLFPCHLLGLPLAH